MANLTGASGGSDIDALAKYLLDMKPNNMNDEMTACKINRAMLAGPSHITKDATIVDMNMDGSQTILRKGTNRWVCMPGNENMIGEAPMCANIHGLVWASSAAKGLPEPLNEQPGIIYMLCGASQHSNTDALDKTSPAIPIGPHWMICWPYTKGVPERNFNTERIGIPNTVRDAGAWQMFDNTPYSYTHICGDPWAGNVYDPRKNKPVWTMQYQASN